MPGTDVRGPSAGSSRGCGSRRSAGTPACCRTSGRCPAPKEDRYKLLRATGVNTSPVVGLYDDPDGAGTPVLDAATARAADLDVIDDDGVRHRLWAVPADGDAAEAVAPLLAAAASAGPITIADGHHRYETALRYRDERRMSRSCEEDPAFDYILMLFLETTGEPLTVLPTHRIVRGLGDDGVAQLLARLEEFFVVERDVPRAGAARAVRGGRARDGGEGRFGLWTRAGGALLTARRDAFEAFLPPGGAALRGLDVTLLGVALERLAGIDAEAVAGGRRRLREVGRGGHRAGRRRPRWRRCGLPPRADAGRRRSRRSRADGDVMPQKSTYFYPEGPDRPGHQPARVVNPDARYDA